MQLFGSLKIFVIPTVLNLLSWPDSRSRRRDVRCANRVGKPGIPPRTACIRGLFCASPRVCETTLVTSLTSFPSWIGGHSAGVDPAHRRSARQPGPDGDPLLLPHVGDNLRWYGITWGAVEFQSHNGPDMPTKGIGPPPRRRDAG